ncbi:hypothetical protein Tcan_08567 [Toxocara canis]|uniref:Uncharacterized protein n=1 Tax=Toxocara canis TaxID=6265 RepID=A0A0B2VHQ3_TOXCA|nr:hypothetical protein Tcan_08567 [Toxocara canis]
MGKLSKAKKMGETEKKKSWKKQLGCGKMWQNDARMRQESSKQKWCKDPAFKDTKFNNGKDRMDTIIE